MTDVQIRVKVKADFRADLKRLSNDVSVLIHDENPLGMLVGESSGDVYAVPVDKDKSPQLFDAYHKAARYLIESAGFEILRAGAVAFEEWGPRA